MLSGNDEEDGKDGQAAGRDDDAVHLFASEQPAEEYADDRIDVFVGNGDHGAGVQQQPEITGVGDDRPKDDQIEQRPRAQRSDGIHRERGKLPKHGGTHEALQAADEHQQAARLYDGKLGLARLFFGEERASHPAEGGAQHKQDAPSGVRAGGRLIDAEKDEARKAGPEPEELH